VGDGVAVGVAVGVGGAVAVAVGDAEAVAVAVGVWDAVGVAVGVALGSGDEATVAVGARATGVGLACPAQPAIARLSANRKGTNVSCFILQSFICPLIHHTLLFSRQEGARRLSRPP
jgi:hypothetical protein